MATQNSAEQLLLDEHTSCILTMFGWCRSFIVLISLCTWKCSCNCIRRMKLCISVFTCREDQTKEKELQMEKQERRDSPGTWDCSPSPSAYRWPWWPRYGRPCCRRPVWPWRRCLLRLSAGAGTSLCCWRGPFPPAAKLYGLSPFFFGLPTSRGRAGRLWSSLSSSSFLPRLATKTKKKCRIRVFPCTPCKCSLQAGRPESLLKWEVIGFILPVVFLATAMRSWLSCSVGKSSGE